jgi:tetratricopeptide (TPR) repeat protein
MAHKAYESEPVKMTLTKDKYQQGKRDVVLLFDRVNGYVNLKEAIEFLSNDESQPLSLPGITEPNYYIPQHKFRIPADSALVFGNGTIKPEMAGKYIPELKWEISRNYLLKNHLLALDFLSANEWERPFYFAITVGNDNYINLDRFFEMGGLAYRIIPAVTTDNIGYTGGINTETMYNTMMNKFKWGGIENDEVYLDENCRRMMSNMRHNFSNLADALLLRGKRDSAAMVLDKSLELLSNDRIPFDVYMLSMVNTLYQLEDTDKARDVATKILENAYQDLDYFISLDKPYSNYLTMEKRFTAHIFRELINVSHKHGDKVFSAEIQQRLQVYGQSLNTIYR